VLGVEADLAEAGEVLARRVEHPLLVVDGRFERGEVGDLGRIEEERAAPLRYIWMR
jgi:hypothetical protein